MHYSLLNGYVGRRDLYRIPHEIRLDIANQRQFCFLRNRGQQLPIELRIVLRDIGCYCGTPVVALLGEQDLRQIRR